MEAKSSSESRDCSLEEFSKRIFAAVAMSSSDSSGENINGSTTRLEISDWKTAELDKNDESTAQVDSTSGSTTRLESGSGSTTRLGSSGDSTTRIELGDVSITKVEGAERLEPQTLSLDDSRSTDYSDPFEGVFYRTDSSDSRTTIYFVSSAFYWRFRDKIQSDFSLSMEDNVIRCVTHFRGLKCDMRIDNMALTVTVSGVGHKIWREDFFPVIARLLFAQYVQFADSQINETYASQCMTDGKNAELCGADPSSAVKIRKIALQKQAPLTTSKIDDPPMYTSTPILNRTEPQQERINMQPALEIIKRLDEMASGIRMFKQTVISDIQLQMQDLKSSVLSMIGKMKPERTYASVVEMPSRSSASLVSKPEFRDPKPNNSRDIHEGARNQSRDEGFYNYSSDASGSSQTLLKVVYTAN
ncbi:MAG: hypothetical protein N0C90_19140, partial [Candidatus Thiodiazotropha endolucinida]|nr:hypothetical protein [Candidatus Thiodiazotropha taylori]MCW4263470.1 hypothetical protein [Candidatus Thiodiazotropha endolucinida]